MTDDRSAFTADDYVRATAKAVGVDPDDAVAYRHRTLQANAERADDRSAFTEARTAGKAIHQQQRLDRVQAREDHSPVGIRSTDVGPFVACSCGDSPTPKHWLETHWPGDSAEGMRLVDELVASANGAQ